jgi:hypothetical protein
VSRPELIPIDRIVELLQGRAPELARTLLPRGHHEGIEWREARRNEGGEGDSLSIATSGDRAGVFYHGAAGVGGDALDAIAYLATNGDKTAAIKWAKAWLGLDGTDPAALKLTRAAQERREHQIDQDEEDAAARRKSALAIFLAGEPELLGTPVDRYLRGRGLDLRKLDWPVRALRYHPGLWNKESQRKWPAMVASVVDRSGQTVAVHRTWLAVRPDGSVTKAPLDRPKMVLGNFRGGAIRLWRGTRVDPKTGEIKQGRRLGELVEDTDADVTEGIEDGLTVAIGVPEARVLVGISVGNFLALELPDLVRTVNLWQQRDAPDSPAAATVGRAIERWRGEGRTVRVCLPPEGVKDVNDVVKPGQPASESAVGA